MKKEDRNHSCKIQWPVLFSGHKKSCFCAKQNTACNFEVKTH